MEFSLRKVVAFLILLLVVIMGIFFISNSSKSITSNVKLVSLEAEKKSCEIGLCKIINCDYESLCTEKEIEKWNSMKTYAKECSSDIEKCDTLQKAVINAVENGENVDMVNKLSNLGHDDVVGGNWFVKSYRSFIAKPTEISQKSQIFIEKNSFIKAKFGVFENHGSITSNRIVLHHTGGGSLISAETAMKDHTDNLGVHFIVDKDGSVYMYANLEDLVYHAGPANSEIGIEIVNSGNEDYTQEQYDSIKKLIIAIDDELKLTGNPKVIGHFEVIDLYGEGTKGKWDPSPNFNWDKIGFPRDKVLLANHCTSSNDFKGTCYISNDPIIT